MHGLFTKFVGTFVGYTGGAAEMKFVPSGTAVTEVRCAAGGFEKNGKKYAPTWVRLVFWGKAGEIANKVLGNKGVAIEAEGRIEVKAYQGKAGPTPDLRLVVNKLGVYGEDGVLKGIDLEAKPDGSDMQDAREANEAKFARQQAGVVGSGQDRGAGKNGHKKDAVAA